MIYQNEAFAVMTGFPSKLSILEKNRFQFLDFCSNFDREKKAISKNFSIEESTLSYIFITMSKNYLD